MKIRNFFAFFLFASLFLAGMPVSAQIKLNKAVNSIKKGVDAFTLTDEQMAQYCKVSVDWMDAGVAGALSDSQLGSLGQSLIGAKYSQRQEREADDFGYEFLKAHNCNPWGMVMAFEKLQNLSSGTKASYIQKMFSSHPETAYRISRMEKRAQKDGIARPDSK